MKIVLNFNVACELKKNGCQTVVRLGEFLDHVRDCRLATERLLPKVYQVNPQTEALEQMNAHFEEIKRFMRDLQTENKQLRDAMVEVQTSAVANTEQMTTITKDLQKQLSALKEGTNKQEKEIHEMKNVLRALQNNQLETCVAISEHVTKKSKELLSRLDHIVTQSDQTKNNLAVIQADTKMHDEKIVEIKKAIAGVVGATNKQLTTVKQQMISRFFRIEMQNKMQLEYKQTQSTDFLSFLGRYGETLPRDVQKEVHTGDSLDTTFNWTINRIREKTDLKMILFFAESEEFPIPAHELKFIAWAMSISDSHMFIRLIFINESSAVCRPFLHLRKYFLVDQSNGGGKKDVVILEQPLFGQNSAELFLEQIFYPIQFIERQQQVREERRDLNPDHP